MPQGPRRIAIVACLAAAGPAGLTRDKLIARLWPEIDEDRARRNLSQLLYAMRTELGVDLVEGTGTLRLAPETCTSDLLEFDAALAARRDADALTVYGGAFLDGFHLAESAEFSQWADAERERRIELARKAAERLAEAATAEAAPAAWKRASLLDPLNRQYTLRLMAALAAQGDRAGAVRAAEKHAALLKTELDAAPDPEVERAAARLRSEASAPPRTTIASPGPAPAAPAPARTSDPGGSAPTRGRRVPWRLAATVTVIVAVLGAFAWSRSAPARLGADEYVLIAQVDNRTADTLLDRSLGTALAVAIQQSSFVTPLPRARVTAALRRMRRVDTTEYLALDVAREVAERENVRLVIASEVVTIGERFQLITRIIEAGTGRIAAARSFGVERESDLIGAVDRAARQLRRDLGEARRTVSTSPDLPEVTTASLAALQEYGRALDAERGNRGDAVYAFLQRAVERDSTFAAAYAKLAEQAALNNDVPSATRYGERALALAAGLPPVESLRIRMSVAWANGDRESSVTLGRQFVDLRPRDFAAWARLAFALFSAGQHEGARDAYARAQALSPLSAGSFLNWGTAWLSAAREGERAAFDSARRYYERAFDADSSLEYDTFYNHQYGTILLGAGLPDSARATFERMAGRTDFDRARALRSLAYLEAEQGDWTHVGERFAAAATIGTAKRQWTTAIRNEVLAAEAAMTLGERGGAAAPLARATAIAMREPIEARMLAFVALAQVRAGDVPGARRMRDRMRALARPNHDAEQAALGVVDGAIALAEGNATLALERLEEAHIRDDGNLPGSIMRARAYEAAGLDSAALDAWSAIAAHYDFGVEGQFEWQYADAERGRLLERLGRTDDAITALRRLVAKYPVRAGAREPAVLRDARERLRRLEGARLR